jgi:colicin import membrane protein
MKRSALALAALAALACGTSKKQQVQQKPVTVSEADYGRLDPSQTQLVDQARADRGRANDELARAKLRQADAQHEDSLARADLTAADAEKARAEARTRMAKESNDPRAIEQARDLTEVAALRRRTAEARAAWAKEIREARDAEVAAAERRVAYEDARVEQAKLQALQQAQVPAATKYDPAPMDARVATARRDLEAAEGAARQQLAEAGNAERAWRELDRQLQARLGAAGPRG